jgi:cysteinyl-tRNA synthetase
MTEIRLHDTMAREKRAFTPADPGRVTMYVCGPTVYNRAHIGNARPAVVFDVLARLLRHAFGEDSLVYARNVTDVDDKIIEAARAEGVDPSTITERYERFYVEDMGGLGVQPPTIAPHATTHVPQMVAMIARLIEAGNAYETDGHVLFHVPSDPAYGALGRRDREAMIAGARVEVASYKKDPADFVLWKPSPEEMIGWDSPWGRGRPGWHIECSAMIEEHLGRTIDIHGGGLDLIFPHHENEIAQSRCAHQGAPLARYWVHNGFLSMAGSEKMSKSLGNVVSVAELLAQGHKGEVLRFALLSAHYRQPLEWSSRWCPSTTLDRYRAAGNPSPARSSLRSARRLRTISTRRSPSPAFRRSTMPRPCARAARCSVCSARATVPGFRAKAMPGSTRSLRRVPRPRSSAILPRPTASAPTWPRTAYCSKIHRRARRGEGPERGLYGREMTSASTIAISSGSLPRCPHQPARGTAGERDETVAGSAAAGSPSISSPTIRAGRRLGQEVRACALGQASAALMARTRSAALLRAG